MGKDALGEQKARRAVQFFEKVLTHTKGRFAGQPFLLADWQKEIICSVFGTLRPDGNRQYRQAYIEIPKKNGKSEIAAGVALYMLFSDGEPGAEVYSAAATRDQASIVFRVAAKMVENSPLLKQSCVIVKSTKTIYLKKDDTSFYRAISADAGVQDGINPSGVIFDELHRQKNSDLWDVLFYGMDTRTQPLLFQITTAGIASESTLCWNQHEYAKNCLEGVYSDPRFYACIYGLGEDEDWKLEGQPAAKGRAATGWYKANPALGDFIDIETVRGQYQDAVRTPSKQNGFRRFRCNQWVESEEVWIPLHEWDACKMARPELVGRECYAGLDLSTRQDLTALTLLFPFDDYVFALGFPFLPREFVGGGGIRERSIKHNAPYDIWANAGDLELTEGNVVDYGHVRRRINELGKVYNIRQIGLDPWNAAQVTQELAEDGFEMVEVRQGFASMSDPCKEIETRVLGRLLRHDGHPVLRWAVSCCSVKQDPAGNIKPVKPDRLKTGKRIDPVVAMANAMFCLVRHEAEGVIDPDELMFA